MIRAHHRLSATAIHPATAARAAAWATARRLGWTLAVTLSVLPGARPAWGQFVAGEWVTRGEAAVQQYRTQRVAFLVLDAQGRLAEGASVRVVQQRHAFELGLAWPGPEHLSSPPLAYLAADPPAEGESPELWRAFNAVSLEAVSDWRDVQPAGGDRWQTQTIDEALAWIDQRGWSARWGVLIEEDAFGLPEWVVPLRGRALADAGSGYLDGVLGRYGKRLVGVDLVRPEVTAEGLTYPRMGPAVLLNWAQRAEQRWGPAAQAGAMPSPRITLRVDQGLAGSESFEALRALDAVVSQRLPFDGFTVGQRFGPRAIRQEDLEPAIRRLAKFGRPLIIADLEIAGSNPIEAAANVELVLRTLFAEPMVRGIYFAGLTAAQVVEPSAALLDEQGQATASGRVVDRLFRENWWSDERVFTDDLGRAEVRVFRGDYRVEVTWSDGTQQTMELRVLEDLVGAREVIVMPIAEGE